MNRAWSGFFAALVLSGCATSSSLNWTFPQAQGGQGVPLDQWLQQHPMSQVQDVVIEEISRGPSASTHLVRIRRKEPLHVHQRHDVVVILLKGSGTLLLDGRPLELKPGSIVTISRGVPHAFTNRSPEPSVAYATFTPAFDGSDMVPVKEPKKR